MFGQILLVAAVAVSPVETTQLQQAIDDTAAKGGGEVVVSPGVHVSGQLWLKDNVSLILPKGAVLAGSTNLADYASVEGLPEACGAGEGFAALVSADRATNVAIRGEGVLDGRGRLFPAVNYGGQRPRLVHFRNCGQVAISDVVMTNSARWTCFLQRCVDVSVSNVTIDAHANFNNDGFDVEARNVLLEDCVVDSDDDAICIKSHSPDFPVEHIVVRNCRVASNCNALKFGTRSYAPCRDIVISNCVVRPCRTDDFRHWHKMLPKIPGLEMPISGTSGLALEMVDGGVLENVRVSGIDMSEGGVQTPIFIRLDRRNSAPAGRTSAMRNIVISDVKARAESSIASSITGVPGLRPSDITLRNVEIVARGGGLRADIFPTVPESEGDYPENRMFDFQMLPGYGFYIRHADRIRFENVRLSVAEGRREEREAVVTDDTSDVAFTNCTFRPADRPKRGPERAGGVFPRGGAPVLWLDGNEAWTLRDWLGRDVRTGSAEANGRTELSDLACGYYTVATARDIFTVVVVPEPASRRPDPDGFLGVDSALSWISKPQLFSCLWHGGDTFRYMADLMYFAGVRRARERLSWPEVQPSAERSPELSYYWWNARRLQERGIAVCGMFQNAPKWTKPIARLPGDFAALYRFCSAMARNLPAMDAWEFWNEEVEGFAPEAAWDYAAAMKAAALGFQNRRPELKVLNGSLCFNPNAYDSALFANGMGKYIDAVNIHAYPGLADYPKVFGGRRLFAEDVGEGEKAIWVTECGTMAMGVPRLPGQNRKEKTFSPDQELQLAEFFPKSQALQMMEGLARNYFFVFGAFGEDGGKKDFSVVRRDSVPAPAFAAIATTADRLGGKRLVGEMTAPEGVRAFLFEDKTSPAQTVLFWSVSPFESATRQNPVWKVESNCERAFPLAVPSGTYLLTDLCGTPRKIRAGDCGLALAATRFPQYLDGLAGLKVAKKAIPPKSPQRYRPASDEDLTVVLRADVNRDDIQVGGVKSELRLMKDEGRLPFEVWNLSPVEKKGTIRLRSGGTLRGIPPEVVVPAMGRVCLETVYVPQGNQRQKLVAEGFFNGKRSTVLAIDVEPCAEFFRTCRCIELGVGEPGNWRRNDSADEYSIAREGESVKFTVKWNRDADRWFYPQYVLQPHEIPTGAEFLEFEARSTQEDGAKGYVCQNYWLDSAEKGTERHDLPPTRGEWTTYRLSLRNGEDPHGTRTPFDADRMTGFRVGGNPRARMTTFWIRRARLLASPR